VIQTLFFVLVFASAFIALTDWRKGLFLMIVVGMLQDPVRKIMPDAPSYMVLAFVPVWLAICASALFSGRRVWEQFVYAVPSVVDSIRLFFFSLLLAFVVLISNYGLGAMAVGVIGLLGYLFPILAIAVGYGYARNVDDIGRLMMFYSFVTAVMLSGGLMEYWDLFPGWPAIGTEVLGTTWIRHFPGHIVELTSGFYRSPDLMGWHAAMLVMFSAILGMRARSMPGRLVWMGLLVWGAAILLISGRNKMIFMPGIFVAVFSLAQLYRGSFGRTMKALMTAALALSLLLFVTTQVRVEEDYLLYAQKGSDEAVERLTTGGLWSVWVTYQQSGFFGQGLGTASTGARYGAAGTGVKTWQESGLSKLMVELGAIGLFAAMLLIGSLSRTFWRTLNLVPRHSPELLLCTAFIGVLVANFASFIVSHQAFGDPYLVTLTGLMVGILRAAPKWVTLDEAVR